MLDVFQSHVFLVIILGQEVVPGDLIIVGLLVLLEGLLSIDNALVLGMLVKRLPKHQRSKAWLGDWQTWFQGIEDARLGAVSGYENWLNTQWPLGMAQHAHKEGSIARTPHLLDFHDFRRPECSGFWLVMLACFLGGFLPRKGRREHLS